MKPSILDEDLAGVPSANYHSSQMHTRNIALQGVRIKRRLPRLRIQTHAEALDEVVVRMVSRQRKYLPRGQAAFPRAVFHYHMIGLDSNDMCSEHRTNLVCPNSVLDVRPHPILEALTQLRPPVHQRNPRSVPEQVQCRFRGRIFSSNYNNILIPEGVRLGVIV